MEMLGYIASIFIGLILGVLGGGGSILSIPILVYLFHIDAVTASAYSLFIVGITSLAGAIPKYKEQLVDLKVGFLFGVPSVISIFSTRKWIIPLIPDVVLHVDNFVLTKRILLLGLFALLMILASFSLIRRKEFEKIQPPFKSLYIILEGTVIGLLTGLVGAGGGFLIIPALVLLTGLPFKTAVGTSLFIISINTLSGFIGDVMNYKIDWEFLFSITSLAVIGIMIGSKISKYISPYKLRISFGWFILIMGCYILVKEFSLI